jgi:glycosyltransferase involved in cell wall biosynthesis
MMSTIEIAIPAGRSELRRETGAGRVWHTVCERLGDRTRVRVHPMTGDHPRRGLFRKRPDVWLAPGHEGAVLAREPVVAVVHGSAWTNEPRFWDMCPREYGEKFIELTEATLRSASCVVVPSEYTRRGLVDGYGMRPDQVIAVPHGVDAEVFSPRVTGGRELVASALGHPVPYVLFAAIPTIPYKNLVALRAAVDGLARAGLPHALVIAGGRNGATDAKVAEVTGDLPSGSGRVAWLGHLDDRKLAAVMAEADAFCLPSLLDSFGLTALEAMACGAPVVVSNRGALPEVVGDAGLICDPTPGSIQESLERVLTDSALSTRLRAAGRARAEQMTWDRTTDGWLWALTAAAEGAWPETVMDRDHPGLLASDRDAAGQLA